MPFSVLCARLRVPLVAAGLLTMILGVLVAATPVWLTGLGVLIVGLALYLRVGTVRREPIEVRAPITGRWSAIHSPADKVPSHGLHAYGQTYAIDLVHEPADDSRPAFGWWPPVRRPTDFPGFGQPLLAPADGVVVRTHGWERDHWSRSSWLSLPFLLVEGMVRELLGPGRLLGNHVVLDLGDGVYAVLAHVRRRSLRVAKGQRVSAGEPLAQCGNSGNSSEPHVHFQLMDHRNVLVAAGLPFEFHGTGVPRNEQPFVAG
jgi:Peptidase family M23